MVRRSLPFVGIFLSFAILRKPSISLTSRDCGVAFQSPVRKTGLPPDAHWKTALLMIGTERICAGSTSPLHTQLSRCVVPNQQFVNSHNRRTLGSGPGNGLRMTESGFSFDNTATP